MSSQSKTTVIIVPAYNEEGHIKDVIARIKKAMTDDMELVVVDDGSHDSTPQILKDTKTHCITLGLNSGYGIAVQTGIKYALSNNFKYAVLIDADGQHNPEDISILLDIVKKGEADLVIGSRFLKEVGYKGSIFRRLGERFFSFLIYILSGVRIKDPTSGFQALDSQTQKIYASDLFPVDYPDADLLLLLSFRHLKIKEVPVRMNVNIKKSMHSGIGHIFYYVYKILLSMLVILSEKGEIEKGGR